MSSPLRVEVPEENEGGVKNEVPGYRKNTSTKSGGSAPKC